MKSITATDIVIALIVFGAVASLMALRYQNDGRSGSGKLALRWEETNIWVSAAAGILPLLRKIGRA